MIKVICVNGAAGSGKTTFENMCLEILDGNGHIASTIDWVKEVCKKSGWNGEKTPEVRKFLSDMKDLMTKSPWGNIPLIKIKEVVTYLITYNGRVDEDIFLFCDVREPQEIDLLKEELHANTLCIRRAEAENQPASNHADAEVLNYDYDIIIENNGSIEDLKNKAKEFIIEINKCGKGIDENEWFYWKH